jgi:DNA-binding NarL/FixJ family response regulator
MKPVPLTLAIADDHVLFRKGLVALLKEIKGVQVLFEATNGRQLLDGMATRQPDLAIVDVEMPEMDGVETTRQLRIRYPNVKILIISMHDDENLILNLLEEGAHGYLLKSAEPNEVRKALEELMELGFYYNSLVVGVLHKATLLKRQAAQHQKALSPKELEVLALLVQEQTNAEVAKKLAISVRTVEYRRARIMEKTGARNLAGLIRFAINQGLVPKNPGNTPK